MLEQCWVVPEKSAQVKAILARRLRKQGYTQKQISELLEITQPRVSSYLKLTSASNDKFQDLPLGKVHFSTLITREPVEGAFLLATKEQVMNSAKRSVLMNLGDAVELLKEGNLTKVLPKVKVNLAMALGSAAEKAEIAAFPSGLAFSKGKLCAYSEPEFGVSNHLSQILLYAKKRNPEIGAVMNLSMDASKKNSVEFDAHYRIKKGTLKDFAFHKGGFGIEPALYVFGKDAQDVVKKVLTL